LEARVQSDELAYRMQLEATDAFGLTTEPASIRELYGDTVQGRQLLTARRLLERGVRFVQVWHGGNQPWNNHDDLEVNHRKLALQSDQASGALLQVLKQRGMLQDTLVIWGGEFGRTPVVELPTAGACREVMCTAPRMTSVLKRWRNRSTCTIFTPRFSPCWVSIMKSLPIAMRAATFG